MSYLAVRFNKLVDDQLIPALACELGHPAGAFTNIQIPPSFFPIQHFQSADSQYNCSANLSEISIFKKKNASKCQDRLTFYSPQNLLQKIKNIGKLNSF